MRPRQQQQVQDTGRSRLGAASWLALCAGGAPLGDCSHGCERQGQHTAVADTPPAVCAFASLERRGESCRQQQVPAAAVCEAAQAGRQAHVA